MSCSQPTGYTVNSSSAFEKLCYNYFMGRIDEVKELLNTLRVAMSIAFGILVILIGSIIKRYDADKIDILF